MTAPHAEALSKAKIQLMTKPDSVFFVTLCFSLKHEFTNEVPTAATDGKRIMFNPDFFMALSSEERVFLLLHETLHCAYLHIVRLMERDHRKWNIAADHVINLQLIERGYKMPEGGLADPQYKGFFTEEVYKMLPDNPKAPCDMDLMPSDEGTAADITTEIQDVLVRASMASKMSEDKPGTIPGEIEIFLDRLLNPKLPWNRILQKYFQSFNKNDYSFRKPNRRHFPKHYLPSLYSNSLVNVTIAVDTSGSVSDADFLRFISETNGILRMMKPERITLIQFDTELKSIDHLKSVTDLMQVSFSGRGGTHIQPVIEWANENKPQVLLVFTDGEFRWPSLETKVPTIWLIHNNKTFTAPYGRVIHYEI